jgi:hypothetical protein
MISTRTTVARSTVPTPWMRLPRWGTVRCAFERAGCCPRFVRTCTKTRRSASAANLSPPMPQLGLAMRHRVGGIGAHLRAASRH